MCRWAWRSPGCGRGCAGVGAYRTTEGEGAASPARAIVVRDSSMARSGQGELRPQAANPPASSEHERNQRLHLPPVRIVLGAERVVHHALLEPRLVPEGPERDRDGQHAGPPPARERAAGEGDENPRVD